MKEVLIVFIVLLILLLLLSTLGGSIRMNENYDDIPLYDESLLPSYAKPWEMNPQFIPQEQETQNKNNKNESRPLLNPRRFAEQETPLTEGEQAIYPFDGNEAYAAVN